MKTTRITLSGRCNNLHLIRFFAAIGVIICHSFSITQGNMDQEWLVVLSNGQLNFGLVSVAVLFLFAGFFAAKSAEKYESFFRYSMNRIKRIVPSLGFVVVLTILVGVIFSEDSANVYFLSPYTWRYLLNIIFIPVHNLPGVFLENPYLPTVNGSLWTLPVEFLCFLACYFLIRLGEDEKKNYFFSVPIVLMGVIFGEYLSSSWPMIDSVLVPSLFFYFGVGYWVNRDKIILSIPVLFTFVIGLIVSCHFQFGKVGLLVFLPYITFYIAFYYHQVPGWLGKLGDFSYGMYLWGFPIQQAVENLFIGKITPMENLCISLPIDIMLGIVTYFLIENRRHFVVRAGT